MEKRFTTFEGVFTPTLLSILGVIMYLRLGWVVGQAGIVGAVLIIVFANVITLATALSMSSVVTNIQIGTGGAYSIIRKSLGIEAGGAIGLPLYLSQAISVAFYITGFSECWRWIFPGHNAMLVSLVVWTVMLTVSYVSARLAFRLQYGIMAIVGVSLIAIFLGGNPDYTAGTVWEGLDPKSFWPVFAVFFPAATGVLAGASMSGELIDARKAIPKGTLAAVGVSFVIYILLAIWLGTHASAQDLSSNTMILMDLGRWRWAVLAGVMGATLSSALSMYVGAPRTLLALGQNRSIPFPSVFARMSKRGEPAAAILLTALIVLITFAFGSLDSVATLLTQFFLITYGMINLSVFIEQSIGIASFRPSFKIPKYISFFGALGCFATMLLINPVFTGVAILAIIVLYVVLLRREIQVHSPDVRSGLLIFLAENFAKAAARLPYHPKIWKPNVICPVFNAENIRHAGHLMKAITFPSGRMFFLCVDDQAQENDAYQSFIDGLKGEDLFVENAWVKTDQPTRTVTDILQVEKASLFPPNTLFYVLPSDKENDDQTLAVLAQGVVEELGLMILLRDEEGGFGKEQTINLWIRKGSPNIHLAVLTALQLSKNWDAHIRVLQVVGADDDASEALNYLERIKQGFRLPSETEMKVLNGDFRSVLVSSPQADINIFGMAMEPDLNMIRQTRDLIGTPVLFLRDSKHESAVA